MLSPADLYSALRATGLHHGPAFAALTRIVRRPNGTSETEIVLPDEATGHRGYRIHPVLLDAASYASAEDFDYALGCECADPSLQIERWGQEAAGASDGA